MEVLYSMHVIWTDEGAKVLVVKSDGQTEEHTIESVQLGPNGELLSSTGSIIAG